MEDRNRTVLREPAGSGLDLVDGPDPFAGTEPEAGSDRMGIARKPQELKAPASRADPVPEQTGLSLVDADEDIGASVLVEVGDRDAALFPRDADAALGGRDGSESAAAIAREDETQAGVEAGSLGFGGKEVLGEEHVVMAVTVEVSDSDSEGRRELGFPGKGNGFEPFSSGQQED